MTIARWAGIAAALALTVFATAPQADCDWKLLGVRQVNHSADHDVIDVKSDEGPFKSIELRVKSAPVEFNKVTVFFEKGNQQVVEMRDRIQEGGKTRQIDLQGDSEARRITRVQFDYRTDESGNKAIVELWGIKS
jgi:hypothetical protein